MMDWGDSGWSWWWMLPMMMAMVVVVGAVVYAIIALTRPTSSTSSATAEDVLRDRFARGEIDSTEYKERVDVLKKTGAPRR